jgi:hypothetical protein
VQSEAHSKLSAAERALHAKEAELADVHNQLVDALQQVGDRDFVWSTGPYCIRFVVYDLQQETGCLRECKLYWPEDLHLSDVPGQKLSHNFVRTWESMYMRW